MSDALKLGGFRFADADLESIQRAIATFRDALRPMALAEAKAMLLSLAVGDLDTAAATEAPPPASPLALAATAVLERQAKVRREGLADPGVDWTVELVILPHPPEALGVLFTERDDWRSVWFHNPAVLAIEDEDDWAFLTPEPFCLQGFTATVMAADSVTREALVSLQAGPAGNDHLLPSWERRLARTAKFLLVRELAPTSMEDVRRLEQVLKSPEGKERIASLRTVCAAKLVRRPPWESVTGSLPNAEG
jgi:hypothetical protein